VIYTAIFTVTVFSDTPDKSVLYPSMACAWLYLFTICLLPRSSGERDRGDADTPPPPSSAAYAPLGQSDTYTIDIDQRAPSTASTEEYLLIDSVDDQAAWVCRDQAA